MKANIITTILGLIAYIANAQSIETSTDSIVEETNLTELIIKTERKKHFA